MYVGGITPVESSILNMNISETIYPQHRCNQTSIQEYYETKEYQSIDSNAFLGSNPSYSLYPMQEDI